MTSYEVAIVVAAGASLVLNLLIAVVGLTWGIGKIRDTIRKEMAEDLQSLEHSIGQTFTAIRTKIQEIELYVRDTYVRRDSFYQSIQNMADDMRGNFDKIDKRLERMEETIRRP